VSLILLSISLIATGASAPVSPSAVTAGGDTCASPTLISSLPFNDSGNTTGAADDIRITGCSGFLSMPGPDLIYTFDVFPGNNLTFMLTTTDSSYDPAIYIRTACPQTSGTCVAHSDTGGAGQPETIMISGLAPGTYYFYIDSVFSVDEIGGSGPYSLSVTGTFGVPNNTSFFTLTPCRLLDTRNAPGPLGGPALVGGGVRAFPITGGQCMVPSTAKAVSVNATVTEPTAQGHITLFPGGAPLPLASTINYRAGQTRANNAIVPLGTNGSVSAFCGLPAGNTTHFILDVNGYFQ
jgi:hypothetical protein